VDGSGAVAVRVFAVERAGGAERQQGEHEDGVAGERRGDPRALGAGAGAAETAGGTEADGRWGCAADGGHAADAGIEPAGVPGEAAGADQRGAGGTEGAQEEQAEQGGEEAAAGGEEETGGEEEGAELEGGVGFLFCGSRRVPSRIHWWHEKARRHRRRGSSMHYLRLQPAYAARQRSMSRMRHIRGGYAAQSPLDRRSNPRSKDRVRTDIFRRVECPFARDGSGHFHWVSFQGTGSALSLFVGRRLLLLCRAANWCDGVGRDPSWRSVRRAPASARFIRWWYGPFVGGILGNAVSQSS